ncbi:MAG: PadR family transcriptional regulator [Kiritimatiellae bacterium]|nr:PadR family transcriptional regulator [Kiritimatiellia bacterium]
MHTWIPQFRKGLVELAILHVLRRGETYGYEIVQSLRGLDALAVSESTVYPALMRLREEGCVRVREAPSVEGPPRRYFSLTSTGRLRLAAMSAYWDMVVREIEHLREGGPGGRPHHADTR